MFKNSRFLKFRAPFLNAEEQDEDDDLFCFFLLFNYLEFNYLKKYYFQQHLIPGSAAAAKIMPVHFTAENGFLL